MPAAFDAITKTATDYGVYWNKDGVEYDTHVTLLVDTDEDGEITVTFKNENNDSISIVFPPDRLKALLAL